jgi:hypothetical protein
MDNSSLTSSHLRPQAPRCAMIGTISIAFFSQAVNRLLLVAGVVALGEHAFLDQHFQPVGEDVGGDTFLRFQQFAKMPLAAEYHVAQDQQAPFVTE